MASHTRTLIGRTIFGSVTEYVLNHAGCPVLIYRSGHVPASQEQVIDESPAKVTGGQA
jgi:hypothetical protein